MTDNTNNKLAVKGLHSDASNEGSDVRERRHHRHRPRPVQGFHPEHTETEDAFA
jgi:hypothetical protein